MLGGRHRLESLIRRDLPRLGDLGRGSELDILRRPVLGGDAGIERAIRGTDVLGQRWEEITGGRRTLRLPAWLGEGKARINRPGARSAQPPASDSFRGIEAVGVYLQYLKKSRNAEYRGGNRERGTAIDTELHTWREPKREWVGGLLDLIHAERPSYPLQGNHDLVANAGQQYDQAMATHGENTTAFAQNLARYTEYARRHPQDIHRALRVRTETVIAVEDVLARAHPGTAFAMATTEPRVSLRLSLPASRPRGPETIVDTEFDILQGWMRTHYPDLVATGVPSSQQDYVMHVSSLLRSEILAHWSIAHVAIEMGYLHGRQRADYDRITTFEKDTAGAVMNFLDRLYDSPPQDMGWLRGMGETERFQLRLYANRLLGQGRDFFDPALIAESYVGRALPLTGMEPVPRLLADALYPGISTASAWDEAQRAIEGHVLFEAGMISVQAARLIRAPNAELRHAIAEHALGTRLETWRGYMRRDEPDSWSHQRYRAIKYLLGYDVDHYIQMIGRLSTELPR